VAELPTGTVTFLFTDIEGSTRLWQEQPDAMRAALARHDEILRAAIAAHDGHCVKTTGDGAHAAFATASDAIDAAVSAQLAIGAEPWALPNPLRVRAGIHTGSAELRDGDYYGTAVNRAARIMSVAHGGQIVVSLAAEELVRDEPVELLDLGEHRLKDLGQPERIFQVVHPALEREFPPLQSLDTFNTNLPAQRTSFLGRERELEAIKQALGESRLVTLTGVGGVGKTRLAVQVAAELVGDFPDGVWLVELGTVADPGAVPEVVAGVLGLVTQPGRTTTQSVAEALASRRMLLVLDNCEHLLDAVATILDAAFVWAGPSKVLATSREGLRVDDERLWPVPSLGSRDGNDQAVALFVERAGAVVPGFDIDAPGAAEAVSEICRRLDGIPLAIELAAARTIAMGVPELRDRLDDRFRLLSGSRRGLERHQTLRHAMQWSFDLLDDVERAVLDRCAVFAGGFDLAAATAVTGAGPDEYAVLDRLDALVRKSLLTVDTSSGASRYGMLETIRQFAEERLADQGELLDVAIRHARYFAATAQDVITWVCDERSLRAFAWATVELANLRAAFRSAADAGDLDTAASVAVNASFLGFYDEIFEPMSWAYELVSAAEAIDHPQIAMLEASASCSYLTHVDRRDAALLAAESSRSRLDDPRYDVLPFGLHTVLVGPVYGDMGRADLWAEYCQAALRRSPEPDVFARGMLASALAFAGRLEDAADAVEGLMEAAEATRSPLFIIGALSSVGIALFDRDPTTALDAWRRVPEVFREGAGIMTGHYASMLARAEAAHGDPRSALEACRDALLAQAASGDLGSLTAPLSLLAMLLHRFGDDEAAAVVVGCCGGIAVIYPEVVASVEDLRATLGDDTFEALASRGQAMESTEVFRFAQDQIGAALQALPADADGTRTE
jgi:predicted ATPase/class 3 adenylate cyclase